MATQSTPMTAYSWFRANPDASDIAIRSAQNRGGWSMDDTAKAIGEDAAHWSARYRAATRSNLFGSKIHNIFAGDGVDGDTVDGTSMPPTATGLEPPKAAAAPAVDPYDQQNYRGGGGGRDRESTDRYGYTPTTSLSDPSAISMQGKVYGALDGYGNALGGLLPGGVAARFVSERMLPSATVAEAAAARDELAAQIAKDPTFGGGGYDGGYGRTSPTGAGIASNPMGRDPAQSQGQRSDGSDGRSGGEGDSPSGGSAEGKSARDGGGFGGTGSGMYKGGVITKKHQGGPDPRGPDNGFTKTQRGEYVIKKSSVGVFGREVLDAINAGDKAKVLKLLAKKR